MEKEMKLSQLQEEQLHDHLVEVIGIGGLILFGVVMVFLGWLKYKHRNNPPAMKTRQRPKAKAKVKVKAKRR
jgi:hypothetical protein